MIDLVGIISTRANPRLCVGDFEVLKELSFEEAQAALTAYFRSSAGATDLLASPHARRPVEEVVADLMGELFPGG